MNSKDFFCDKLISVNDNKKFITNSNDDTLTIFLF